MHGARLVGNPIQNHRKSSSHYEITNNIFKVQAPIERRAVALKSEMVDSEGLASKLEEKDAAINELHKVVKLKTDDVSELKIRIGEW